MGATVNVTVDVDPVADKAFAPVGDGGEWEIARISTSDRVHTVDASALLSVIVIGYNSYDSPAGLDHAVINPSELGGPGNDPRRPEFSAAP
ncbi:hypothetical protein ENSA5_22850 [Enhygromyxa salina]|uniref:Uncharacterized protein n=1 Tax=Enhygromyxa salina TaxID=215803 RepID=A0A2S9YBG7_9BACT|nr:hypothetical protein ENSA5_22850 [Enhygromyxa salina]